MRPLGLEEVRKFAAEMEYETERYYRKAAENSRDASVRELLIDLAEAEDKHEGIANRLGERLLTTETRAREKTRPRAACSCCNSCSRAWSG